MSFKYIYNILFALSLFQSLSSQTILKKINSPSGDYVSCMTVSNSGKLYFAEYQGGIYTSSDEGISWIRIYDHGYSFHDMKIGIDDNLYVADRNSLLILDQSGNTILHKYFNTDVYSLALDSQLELYAATRDSGIIKTTNYGESWAVNIVLPDSNYHFTSVTIDKDDNIFISTYSGVLKSTDNGKTWLSKNSGLTDFYIFDIMCTSNGYIFLTNNYGIARSTNNGDYWKYVNTGIQSNTFIRKIEEDENSNLYFGDEIQGTIYNSSNWGDNWEPVFQANAGRITSILPVADYLFISSVESGLFRAKLKDSSMTTIHIRPSSILGFVQIQSGEYYAYDSDHNLIFSTDYGNIWRVIGSTGGLWYNKGSILFIGAQGIQIGLIKDRRIEYHWKLDNNDCGRPTSILYEPDSNFIFVSTIGIGFDCYGGIYRGKFDKKTTILSKINNGLPEHLGVTSLAINSIKHLFAGVAIGIYRSCDLGMTWELIKNSNDLLDIKRIIIDNNDNIYACTFSKILRSTDDGESWTNIRDYNYYSFAGPEIDSENNLYIATKNAVLYQILKSTNLGSSWTPFSEMLEDGYVNGLFLSDSSYLFVYTHSGIYRTTEPLTDMGENIQHQPISYYLLQNYPNPFNPTTTIQFQIANSSLVKLEIFDVLGRKVKELLNEEKPAGSYNVEFNAEGLVSGIYFYRLRAGSFTSTKKMILLR